MAMGVNEPLGSLVLDVLSLTSDEQMRCVVRDFSRVWRDASSSSPRVCHVQRRRDEILSADFVALFRDHPWSVCHSGTSGT